MRRNRGLVFFLLVINVALAALLAAPLAGSLERSLHDTGSAETMMYGFDFNWWSRWSDAQSGWTTSFRPDIFGAGFAFKNVDLLLKGALPVGLFGRRSSQDDEDNRSDVDALVLGLGALYLVLQTFLAGGIYATVRQPGARWTVRGLLHGSGFYCGRFLRIAAVALTLDFVLFKLDGPLGRFVDHQAKEAVSETTALAWVFAHNGLLLVGVLLVSLLSGYAKAITVLEERSSALLAFGSAISFCASRAARVVAHYAAIVALGVLLIVVWHALDGRLVVTGYRSQLVALLLAQAFVAGRIALRVALMGGQVAIYRDRPVN